MRNKKLIDLNEQVWEIRPYEVKLKLIQPVSFWLLKCLK